LAKWVVILQIIYLVLKLGDLVLAGEIGLMFTSGLFSALFLVEVIVGLIVPIAIFASKGKESDTGLVIGSICTVVGILLNRWSIAWFALNAPPGTTYSPYWMEWIIAIAAAVGGGWLYSLAVRRITPLRDTVMKEAH
jgi:hypothetical protein